MGEARAAAENEVVSGAESNKGKVLMLNSKYVRQYVSEENNGDD